MPVLQPKHKSGHKANIAIRHANLMTHLLRMCPAKWQTQYDLTEKSTPVNTRALLLILEKIEDNTEVDTKPPSMIKPNGAEGKCRMESIDSRIPKKCKQVGFSDKQCALCKNHGGPHKSLNTHNCHKYKPDGTPIKRNGGTGSAQRNGHTDRNRSNQRECKGANYAQIIRKEVKKAFRKHSHKRKKCRANNSESDSDSDYSSWSRGSNSTGELYMCKKRKLNVSVNDYTYPSPYKAIQQNKNEFNNNFNSEMMQENISTKSCTKKLSPIIMNDINNVSSNKITMKTVNQNTKEKLGVMALIAII